MRKTNKKGFTLIELLMVIAIIGILASIIIVNLNGARNRAKDASIISSAESIMKAVQINSIAANDYSVWSGVRWFGTTSDCANKITSSMGPDYSQMVAACQSIINAIGSTSQANNSMDKLYIGPGGTAANPKLTIMAALPSAQRFYCIGSNGGTSQTTLLDASGCGGTGWGCAGCYYDPNGGGN